MNARGSREGGEEVQEHCGFSTSSWEQTRIGGCFIRHHFSSQDPLEWCLLQAGAKIREVPGFKFINTSLNWGLLDSNPLYWWHPQVFLWHIHQETVAQLSQVKHFLDHCCHTCIRHYSFGFKKCGSRTCTVYKPTCLPPNGFASLHYIHDPILGLMVIFFLSKKCLVQPQQRNTDHSWVRRRSVL